MIKLIVVVHYHMFQKIRSVFGNPCINIFGLKYFHLILLKIGPFVNKIFGAISFKKAGDICYSLVIKYLLLIQCLYALTIC